MTKRSWKDNFKSYREHPDAFCDTKIWGCKYRTIVYNNNNIIVIVK